MSRLPEVELVVVPHEPTQEHVERLAADVMRMFGVPARIWSRLANPATESASSSPLIIDDVGFLAAMSAEADVAYVGGGLDGTGLHSVIEPAAAGLPVLFGARHDRWEARELTAIGGAAEIERSNVAPVLAGLCDGELRESMATAGRAYVESKSGAAVAGSALIERLLDRG